MFNDLCFLAWILEILGRIRTKFRKTDRRQIDFNLIKFKLDKGFQSAKWKPSFLYKNKKKHCVQFYPCLFIFQISNLKTPNFSRISAGAQLKPVFMGFETRLIFIKFRHWIYYFWIFWLGGTNLQVIIFMQNQPLSWKVVIWIKIMCYYKINPNLLLFFLH